MDKEITYDSSQLEVIDANGGYHLVLAPPGCGKTQILTERIRNAHEHGMEYSDMLCLTFTNRAARGMQTRIAQNITNGDVGEVFVGNIHRYCIRLLTGKGIIAANSAIIDDNDALSIMARYRGEDEFVVAADTRRSNEYFTVMHLSTLMHQIRRQHPRELRLHPECLTAEDVQALQSICHIHNMRFTPETMLDIYDHCDTYVESLKGRQIMLPAGTQVSNQQLFATLDKMGLAHNYHDYKREHFLIDFNDILVQTYDAFIDGALNREQIKKRWIQVDEVQDLNPMQLALVDLMTDTDGDFTVMYLGDEQQAIFSFMGAKLSMLDLLHDRCRGNIHHLDKNHRSPRYLLDVYNMFAREVLHIRPEMLPSPTNDDTLANGLLTMSSETIHQEYRDVAVKAQQWLKDNDDETTAIIVLSNADADAISMDLQKLDVPHFKISGTDLFSTPEMKTLLAHFSALTGDNNFIAWSRLLLGTGALPSAFGARDFIHNLLQRAISPAELLTFDETDTYTQRFIRAFEGDIVVFDTETTGLDTFNDDIVQIAATRLRNGERVGDFVIHLETDRKIPLMLGDIVNPIIEERKNVEIVPRREALRRFMEFAGDATLLAHNADFDIHILDSNLKREGLESIDTTEVIDSLRLIRLLEPSLKVYKLKYLIDVLSLEGCNSHLADDDVFATCSLVAYCYKKAKEMRQEQVDFLSREMTIRVRNKFRKAYADVYKHSMGILWSENENRFTDELRFVHDAFTHARIINKVEKLDYVCTYIDGDIIDLESHPQLIQQLQYHSIEINTLKEADLCNSAYINERIYVSTVHKAKGLEFDNVIVFDAVDGRYPGFYSKTEGQIAEDARKFYVAMTRARKRLCISFSHIFQNNYGRTFPREMTRFMKPIEALFRR